MAFLRNDTQLKANATIGGGGSGSGEVFADAAWSVHPTGASGECLIWIKVLPTVRRQYIKIQARVNGGAITDLLACTGMYPVTGLNNAVSNNVEIRVVMFGNGVTSFYEAIPTLADWTTGTIGGWSSVKTVTPVTTGNTAVTPANWAATLTAAAAGQRWKLASGTYTSLTLASKVFTTNPLIIDWDGVGAKPLIQEMSLTTVEGVYVRNLRIAYQPPNSASAFSTGFAINASTKQLTFDQCPFEGGTVVSGGSFVGRGAGWAFDMNPGNEHFLFRDCPFTRFSTVASIDHAESISFSGCVMTLQTADSIQCNNPRGILVEYCTIADWDLPPNDPNHVDAFQIFNLSPTRAIGDIMLRYNKIGSQTALHDVQALFGGMQEGLATYGAIQRLLVYENHIYVTSTHGVSFSSCERSLAWNNTCIRNRLAVGVGSFTYIGQTINDAFAPGVDVGTRAFTYAFNNVAHFFSAANVSANYAITATSPNAANGYNTLFKDSNSDGTADAMGGAGLLSDMVAKPTSVIYTSGYGAAFARI